eukprot:m51a1_g12303 hypothetical protein (177) ;mRNA; f:339496-340218
MNAKIVVFLAAAAAVASGARVYTNPSAGSDNVISVSNGLATLLWAAGNANFRIPPEQQHPAGSLSIRRDLCNTLGFSSVPASSGVFALGLGTQFQSPSPVASSRCVARFGYPAHFGAAWPTVNETLLAWAGPAAGADLWAVSIPLPAAGGLLEVTARCVCNGIESWLGGNYQVQAY